MMNQEFKTELRLYAFVNFYLSSIQQGIQTGHAAVDMVKKYQTPDKNFCDTCGNAWEEHEFGVPAPYCAEQKPIKHVTAKHVGMVHDWAVNHKTFITLNGGPHAGIVEALKIAEESGYPFVAFNEDEYSLNGLMTCVAMVLPDYIFNMRRQRDPSGETYYTWTRVLDDGSEKIYIIDKKDKEFALVDFLKSKNLAI